MTAPLTSPAHSPAAMQGNAIQIDPSVLRGPVRPQLRRYDIQTLLPNGNVVETRHIAPALPLFEDAFCAFTRGSVLDTAQGPVAIEDLWPGDQVRTRDHGAQPVLWKGRTLIVPGRACPTGRDYALARVMTEAFGLDRPFGPLQLGPAARLLATPPHLRKFADGAELLTPVREFIDGENVIETAPPTAVEVFHLCLPRHGILNFGGLWLESYHPGEFALRGLSPQMQRVFLGLFAHVDTLRDFGPLAFARAGDGQVDRLDL